jgi:hypothetical protein
MMLRRVVSWLVVLVGILLGMLVIAVIGGTSVGVHAPVAVFVTVVAGCVPVLASLIALRNPRRAAWIDLCVSPLTPFLALLFSREFGGVLGAVAVFSGALVVPGFFWLLTSRRNWPPLLQPSRSLRGASFKALLGIGLFCMLVVAATLSSLFLPWWPPVGDCSGRPILTEQGNPRNIDFTARIVFVGPRSFHGWSLWSIARVEQRFGAVPAWPSNLILLRGYFLPADVSRQYLVEGRRSGAAITRFLPVIVPTACGHTALLENATVALRCLRDGLPRSGGRLIGMVHRALRESSNPVAGVKVRITGPAGSSILVTDAQGIYDVTGLPPGEYTIELGAPERHPVHTYYLPDRAIREDYLLTQ